MKRYKYKNRQYFKTLLLVILILIVVIFTSYSVTKERDLTFVESAIKDVSVFIVDTIYAPIKFVKNKLEVYAEKEKIYEKYKKLKNESDDVEQKIARIKELEKENEELRKTLELNKSISDYDIVNATIISRNVGHWYENLVIDKGKKDNIERRMAVVVNNGLIGYISEVGNYSSNVQLLTTKSLKNKISVKIELGNGEYANGLLNGYDAKNGVYTIEGVSYSGEIPNKAYVTTTGLSEVFPSGILVGFVTNTTTDNFDLGKIVEVKPSADFDNTQYVTILKRKAQEK